MYSIYNSLTELADYLGVGIHTLIQRIKRNWPEESWGDIGKSAFVSTGYTWEEAPKHLKETAEKLALGLNISAMEAYQLILEKIEFK